MMQIPHSTFLQALGCAIINSLWQFALLWLVYFLINTFFKLQSRQKYTVALLLQFTGFIWFAGTFVFYYQQWNYISETSAYLNQYYVSQWSAPGASFKQRWLMWIINMQQYVPYLSIAYLLLLMFLSFRWLQSYFYTKHIQQSGISKIDVDWRLFVQKISAQLGIRRRVSIYLSGIVNAPLTIGFLKPVILIPLASMNNLSTEQMEAVILHELAHIKRLDYLLNLLLTLVEVVMFFNPFMQLLSKHIKRERENSCDDWVLQYEYNAATYARALLKIALLQAPAPGQTSFAMNATPGNKEVLLTRVKRMIEKREKNFQYKHQLLALVFTTITLSFIAWFSPAHNNNKHVSAPASPSAPAATPPVVAKLDNPLFNPVFFLADTRVEKQTGHKEAAHIGKKPTRHTPQLAIPGKSEILKLDKIPSPLIIKSSLVQNRIEVLPRLKFKLDSIFHNVKFIRPKMVLTLAQSEKTQREIEKTINTLFQKTIAIKQSTTDKQKAVESMSKALAQLKTQSIKLSKLIPSSRQALTSAERNAMEHDRELELFEQEEAIQALVEQINMHLKELQQQYFAKATNYIDEYTINHPAAVYNTSSAHSFSFEYSDKGGRVMATSTIPGQDRTNIEINKRPPTPVERKDTLLSDDGHTILAPTEKPVRKVIVKRRIIHI